MQTLDTSRALQLLNEAKDDIETGLLLMPGIAALAGVELDHKDALEHFEYALEKVSIAVKILRSKTGTIEAKETDNEHNPEASDLLRVQGDAGGS